MKYLIPLLCLLLTACSLTPKPDANNQLASVIDLYHDYEKQSSPYGDPIPGKTNAQLPDVSPETLKLNHQKLSEIYQQVVAINPDSLTNDNKISWSVLSYRIKKQLDNYTNKEHLMPLTAESGFHAYLSFISRMVSFKTEQDYLDYISRLNQIPRYFEQQMAWMKLGLAEGYTQPKVVLAGFEESIAAFIKSDASESGYYVPFKNMPKHIPVETQQALKARAEQAINDSVFPSYQKFYDFMVEEYMPNARDNIAASSLPNGQAFYDNRVKHFTTLDMTADEVHQVGVKEVKRIRAEMQAIIDDLGFKGNFAEFVEFLRTDPQFYAKTPEDLLKEASFIAKKMDAKLPSLFKTKKK